MTVFLFAPPDTEQDWSPSLDVYRTEWGWILKYELAGVRLEDLNVHVNHRTVTVVGVRRDYMIENGCHHYSMEITYSRFSRSIELPEDVSSAPMRLDYRDGILFVRIRTREGEDCK